MTKEKWVVIDRCSPGGNHTGYHIAGLICPACATPERIKETPGAMYRVPGDELPSYSYCGVCGAYVRPHARDNHLSHLPDGTIRTNHPLDD